MMRKVLVGLLLGVFCVAVYATPNVDRVSAIEKGSLVIFPKIELRWRQTTGDGWQLIQDTFLDLTNDQAGYVYVKGFYVNGDPPVPGEPGWNRSDFGKELTPNQPIFWSAATGLPQGGGTGIAEALDPGSPPGRPDPAVAGERMMRGFLIVWAIDEPTWKEIRWNHLKGDAMIVNWYRGTAWEYNAYAFAAMQQDAEGNPIPEGSILPGTSYQLDLNGVEYDQCFDYLLLDFYRSDDWLDTDITLFPVPIDLTQDHGPPVITKAKYTIWDQNENMKTGLHRCIQCWDQELASRYATVNNYFVIMDADKGKAVIDGEASTVCAGSEAAALLGLAAKEIKYPASGHMVAGGNLHGKGFQNAQIRYSSPDENPEMPTGDELLGPSIKTVGEIVNLEPVEVRLAP